METTNLFTTGATIKVGDREYPSAVSVPNVYDEKLLLGLERLYVECGWDGEEVINYAALIALLGDDNIFAVHGGDFHADELYLIAMAEQIYRSGEPFARIVRTREFVEDIKRCLGVGDTLEGSGDHHGPRADRAHAVCALSRFVRRCYVTDEIRKQQPEVFWQKLAYFVDLVALQDTGYLIYEEVSFIHRQSVYANWSGEDRFEVTLNMVREDLKARMQTWAAEPAAEKLARQIIADNPDASVLVFPKECRACSYIKRLIWEAEHPALYFVSWQSDTAWNILCCAIPKEGENAQYDDRSARYLLPESWACKRGEILAAVTKIAGAIFCHADRWIASWATREGAEKAAALAIKILKGEA